MTIRLYVVVVNNKSKTRYTHTQCYTSIAIYWFLDAKLKRYSLNESVTELSLAKTSLSISKSHKLIDRNTCET